MAHEKSWTYLNNETPLNNTTYTLITKSFVYQLKSFLISNGYSVVSSSNSSSSSSSDLWSDLTSLVFANSPSAHSWILLKTPVGFVAGPDGSYAGSQSQMFICLECIEYNVPQLTLTFYVAPTSDGSNTTIPTGGITAPIGALNNTSYNILKFQFGITTDGNFYAGQTLTSNGKMVVLYYSLSVKDPIVIASSGLDYAYAALAGQVGVGFSNTAVFSHQIFDYYGSQNLNGGCMSFDNSGNSSIVRACILSNSASPAIDIGAGIAGGGDVNGDIPVCSAYLYNTSGAKAVLGKIPDFVFTGANMGNGAVMPLTGPIENCFSNGVGFPTDAVLV